MGANLFTRGGWALTSICVTLAFTAAVSLPASAKSLDQLRDQASALQDKNDCARAYPLFIAAAEKSGGAAIDNLGAAYCAADLGKHRDAIERFQSALRRGDTLTAKDRAAALTGLAYEFEATEQWKDAAQAWEQALALETNDQRRLGAARAWRSAGNEARARELYAAVDATRLTRAEQAEYWTEKSELEASANPQAALAAIGNAIALADSAARRLARAELLTKLGRHKEAVADLEVARKLDPRNADVALALAYAYQSAGRDTDAVALFEEAAGANPQSAEALEDVGYALIAAGRRDEGVAKLKRAIDLAGPNTDPQRLLDMQRKVHEVEQNYFFSGYLTYRSGTTTPTIALPGDPRRLQSAFGFQGGWITPLGFLGDHNIAVVGGMYFALEDDQFELDRDSSQASVGLRWQPVADEALYLSIDRLIALGDNARDAWLASVSFSGGEGTEWQPGKSQWTYASIDASASYVWEAPSFLSATAEGRLGVAFGLAEMWALVPHVLLYGDFEDDSGTHSALVEAGAGISLMHWFCSDHYEGPLCSTQLSAQYRYVLSQDGLNRDDSSVVAEFSFGL